MGEVLLGFKMVNPLQSYVECDSTSHFIPARPMLNMDRIYILFQDILQYVECDSTSHIVLQHTMFN